MQYIQKHNIQYLYHMTALDNLASVLEHGLLSHNEAHKSNLVHVDISNPQVNDRRSRNAVNNILLHDYVNFYFQPKNPMLSAKRDVQQQIVFLGADPRLLLLPSTIFSDGNAGTEPGKTKFWTGTNKLDNLRWDIINAQYWNDFEDGKRIRCAEVLVYPKVAVSNILKIFCHPATRKITAQIVACSRVSIPVQAAENFYF